VSARVDQRFEVELELEGRGSLEVVSCTIRQGINAPVHASVVIASDHLPVLDRHSKKATLSIHGDGGLLRRFELVPGRVSHVTSERGIRYCIDAHSPHWLAGLTRNTRKFRKKSAREIVAEVLARHGVGHHWQIARETPTRNYCVQYAEADLDFIHRLLESEGIHYAAGDDGGLHFSDRSQDAALLGAFELDESSDALVSGAPCIHRFRRRARIGPGRVTLNDFDWKRPRMPLLASCASADDEALEQYEFPAGYRNPTDGAFLARIRLEAERAKCDVADGECNIAALRPGAAFRFTSEDDAFAGDFFVTHVVHELGRGGFAQADQATGYKNRFEAIPLAVPFRPHAVTTRPRVAGNHTAMVRGPAGEEIHTDEHGRFKAQFHWDREAKGTDEDSRWLRLVQECSSSLALARVGWEMSVAYIDGDPDRPIGVARQINGIMPTAYPQPAKSTLMTVKTPSYPASGGYNELRVDDSRDAMSIDVKAERDFDALVRNDKKETIGSCETHVCKASLAVGGGTRSTLPYRQQCLSNHALQVTGNRTLSVGGSDSVDVGARQQVAISRDDRERVGIARVTVAAKIKLPDLEALAKSALDDAKNAALGGAVGGVANAYQQASAMVKEARQREQSPTTDAAAPDEQSPPRPPEMDHAAREKAELSKWAAATAGAKRAFGTALASVRAAGGLTGLAKAGVAGAVANVKELIPSASEAADKLLDSTLVGTIARNASEELHRSVGGLYVSIAATKDLSRSHQKLYLENVGGCKITQAGGAMNQAVGGPLVVNVGASMERRADEGIGYRSKTSNITVAGNATITSSEAVSMAAKTVVVEIGSQLLLAGGGAEIAMKPGVISLSGSVKLDASTKISFKGGESENLTKS
jgi:type VI secretion system secreted protein VgrG